MTKYVVIGRVDFILGVFSWYGVVCARGAVVLVVVGCFSDALVVNTLAWENMMGLVACFVGLCALGNDVQG